MPGKPVITAGRARAAPEEDNA
ncbi:hypothetical protein R2601_03583 [Salipiger bermudensis HTCC2601]|uniref:Uncharacterized protein n=1 Tax=Salipiger bermudensis (strain DSM 26914 / JCM 13377 / KCTC 12554 / HTCC2601) TaxID=314265 RepID=Q0FWC9_SALBH|nr:hypothetical protein R2601_03583 [Salipiger bermudensis HTCC2601]